MKIYTVSEAKAFFRQAHDSINHTRKYSGEPYWVHTESVERLYASAYEKDAAGRIACLGHDCLEDVAPLNREYDIEVLMRVFSEEVVSLIVGLTHVYTKEAYPQFNRRIRKQAESMRLFGCNDKVKAIKICDLIDNRRDIELQDPKFAVTYNEEARFMFPLLRNPLSSPFDQELLDLI